MKIFKAALASQRRAANKKRVQIMRGEDLARQIMEEQQQQQQQHDSRHGSTMPLDAGENQENGTPGIKQEEEEEEEEDLEGGFVLDDTTEFIRNISARPAAVKREQKSSNGLAGSAGTPTAEGSSSSRFSRVKTELNILLVVIFHSMRWTSSVRNRKKARRWVRTNMACIWTGSHLQSQMA
jgi:hypothetical protein